MNRRLDRWCEDWFSAGLGSRIMPLNQISATQRIPKGLIEVIDRPKVTYDLHESDRAGISRIHCIAKDASNRILLQMFMESGNGFGKTITYSHVTDDEKNVGSASALGNYLLSRQPEEASRVHKYHLIKSNDNMYRMEDWQGTFLDFEQRDLPFGIFAYKIPALKAIDTYGVLIPDSDGLLRNPLQWREKPKSEQEMADILGCSIDELASRGVLINGAAYSYDADLMRQVYNEEWVREMMDTDKATGRDSFDIGGHLIPGLLEQGTPIVIYELSAWQDYGNRREFLDSTIDAIAGNNATINEVLASRDAYEVDSGMKTMIHREVMKSYAIDTDKTVEAMIRDGDIIIGPNVRLGSRVRLGTDVRVEYSNVDRCCEIRSNSYVGNSQLFPFVRIGTGTYVKDSILCSSVDVKDGKARPARLSDDPNRYFTQISNSSLGMDGIVPAGASLGFVVGAPQIDFAYRGNLVTTGGKVIRTNELGIYYNTSEQEVFVNHSDGIVKYTGSLIEK